MNPLYHSLRESEYPLLADQSEKEHEGFVTKAHLNLDAGAKGFSPLRGDVQMPLTIIMGMVLLVVAMAIVNVASLLLVRAASRVREFSMRYALGATSGQILRQLLAEGILLGTCGAAVGLLIAPQALRLLIRWMSGTSNGEPVFTATLDWRVLAFTIATTLAASLLFSLAPAVQFWNPRLADALKQQAGTSHGRRSSLPPHLRRAADRLQPAADGCGGPVCAHDSEPAQRRPRLCHRSSACLQSVARNVGLCLAPRWRPSSSGSSTRSPRCPEFAPSAPPTMPTSWEMIARATCS